MSKASDDFPEPERLAPGVPGYTGQYRGEVRIRHVAVCHAGAGAWLAYRMSDDNPQLSAFFPSVLAPAIKVMGDADVPARQLLVRGDAEFGSAGVARAIVNLGGIANLTLLPADPYRPVLGFDTGPANALLVDHFMHRLTNVDQKFFFHFAQNVKKLGVKNDSRRVAMVKLDHSSGGEFHRKLSWRRFGHKPEFSIRE